MIKALPSTYFTPTEDRITYYINEEIKRRPSQSEYKIEFSNLFIDGKSKGQIIDKKFMDGLCKKYEAEGWYCSYFEFFSFINKNCLLITREPQNKLRYEIDYENGAVKKKVFSAGEYNFLLAFDNEKDAIDHMNMVKKNCWI